MRARAAVSFFNSDSVQERLVTMLHLFGVHRSPSSARSAVHAATTSSSFFCTFPNLKVESQSESDQCNFGSMQTFTMSTSSAADTRHSIAITPKRSLHSVELGDDDEEEDLGDAVVIPSPSSLSLPTTPFKSTMLSMSSARGTESARSDHNAKRSKSEKKSGSFQKKEYESRVDAGVDDADEIDDIFGSL